VVSAAVWIVSLPATRDRSVRCSTCRGRTTAFPTTARSSWRLSTRFDSAVPASWSQPSYTAGLQPLHHQRFGLLISSRNAWSMKYTVRQKKGTTFINKSFNTRCNLTKFSSASTSQVIGCEVCLQNTNIVSSGALNSTQTKPNTLILSEYGHRCYLFNIWILH